MSRFGASHGFSELNRGQRRSAHASEISSKSYLRDRRPAKPITKKDRAWWKGLRFVVKLGCKPVWGTKASTMQLSRPRLAMGLAMLATLKRLASGPPERYYKV